MDIISCVFFSLLLLIASNNDCNGLPQRKPLNLKALQWKPPPHSSTSASHKSRSLNGVTILEMKHRDSCSDHRKITSPDHWNENSKKRLVLDDIHVRSLQSRINRTLSLSTSLHSLETRIPLVSGIKLEILNYIVSVELGGRSMSVIVDTGSDLTWVQCQPCKLCYNQKEPLFDPSRSHAFRTVPCDSAACRSLQFATGNSGICVATNGRDACEYRIGYGDGSHTRGELARDTLALGESPVLERVRVRMRARQQGLLRRRVGAYGTREKRPLLHLTIFHHIRRRLLLLPTLHRARRHRLAHDGLRRLRSHQHLLHENAPQPHLLLPQPHRDLRGRCHGPHATNHYADRFRDGDHAAATVYLRGREGRVCKAVLGFCSRSGVFDPGHVLRPERAGDEDTVRGRRGAGRGRAGDAVRGEERRVAGLPGAGELGVRVREWNHRELPAEESEGCVRH